MHVVNFLSGDAREGEGGDSPRRGSLAPTPNRDVVNLRLEPYWVRLSSICKPNDDELRPPRYFVRFCSQGSRPIFFDKNAKFSNFV